MVVKLATFGFVWLVLFLVGYFAAEFSFVESLVSALIISALGFIIAAWNIFFNERLIHGKHVIC